MIVSMKCGDTGGHKANGDPCNRSVATGLTRCNLHGGASPAAKIKAEQLMAIARLPAIEALYTILEQFEKNTCGACGYPVGDADEKRMIIQASKTILDRAGMGPHAVLELVKQSDGDLNLDLLTDEERGALVGHIHQIKAIKMAVRARQLLAPGVGSLSGPSPLPDLIALATSAASE